MIKRRYLTVSEFKKLNKVISDKKNMLVLDLLYETAVTVNELVNIKTKDVDLKRNILKIPSINTKNNKSREIKISLRISSEIKKLNTGTYLFSTRQSFKTTTRRIQQLLLDYGKKAKLGTINPSIIRQSSIAHDLLRNITPAQIEKKTGISNLQPYVYDIFKLKQNLLK